MRFKVIRWQFLYVVKLLIIYNFKALMSELNITLCEISELKLS